MIHAGQTVGIAGKMVAVKAPYFSYSWDKYHWKLDNSTPLSISALVI